MSRATSNLKEAGCEEHTNSRANLWSDEQKSHIRLCMRVRLQCKSKYHIVFAPKFRRKIAYGELKQDIANILSTLCKRKGVEIIEAEICPDHVHMLVRIPPSISVSSFVG